MLQLWQVEFYYSSDPKQLYIYRSVVYFFIDSIYLLKQYKTQPVMV